MVKKVKRQHNIYISDEGDNESKVVIKGNNLNLRWFEDSIIIWSGKKNMSIILLEAIEEHLEMGRKNHGTK